MPPFSVDLLSLSIASAIGPGQILFTVLLLRSSDRGVLRAGSFVGGITAVRLVQGIVFGFIMTGAFSSVSASGQPGVITSTLLLVLGIFLLITAYKQWQHQADPDGPPPKWLKMIDSLTPVKAFGIGLVLVGTSPNLWAFTLNAIAVIGEAQLSRPDSVIAFLMFILLAESVLLLTILIRIILPGQATKFLDAMSAWLNKHNRMLIIATSVAFGLYFLAKGISRFLAF